MANPCMTKNFAAGGTIPAYTIAKFGADSKTVLQSAAADDFIGVTSMVPVVIGEPCDVHLDGICFVKCGGSITRGKFVTADANGNAVQAAPAPNVAVRVLGMALEDGASGDIINVDVDVAQLFGQVSNVEVDAANGAIALKEGVVLITKAGVAVMTLAAPTAGLQSAGGDDGKKLTIKSTTANAHTITTPSGKIDGSLHLITFGGAVTDFQNLVAYNGVWQSLESSGSTIS
jgi:Uncharacterized conserved protein (DUF2190)